MKSLFYSYDMNVDKAYIIRIKGNPISEEKAKNCAESCLNVGMPFDFWDAYDGTGDFIKTPDHLSNDQIMSCIKLTDHYLVRAEVCCALSHISLWAKCVIQDKPIVILEHDAIMVRPYLTHTVFNSIAYLGCNEQAQKGWNIFPTPPHGTDGPNYHFILRAHAYAIDPAVAKNMLAHVLQYGISKSLDVVLRADIFPIHQIGLFAFDDQDGKTTIEGRSEMNRSNVRIDNMK
jgi:hypothetical protein